MHLKSEHKIIFIIAVFYTIALTAGSLMRPIHIIDDPMSNIDKLLHAGAYFGLTALWIFWVLFKRSSKTKTTSSKKLWQIVIGICFMAVLYGVLMEVLQGTLTSYRTPDTWDILANTAGSVLALIACLVYVNKSKMLKSNF
ncbi:VanZ family protein [Dokdonia ponticola]|uniref:VanZ family protein n=1 Tax=Dokdonia ponticola TaxID=2041041 RepID=A0ABV9HV00_9FLAO